MDTFTSFANKLADSIRSKYKSTWMPTNNQLQQIISKTMKKNTAKLHTTETTLLQLETNHEQLSHRISQHLYLNQPFENRQSEHHEHRSTFNKSQFFHTRLNNIYNSKNKINRILRYLLSLLLLYLPTLFKNNRLLKTRFDLTNSVFSSITKFN